VAFDGYREYDALLARVAVLEGNGSRLAGRVELVEEELEERVLLGI
jgi:hypothetical protein